MANKPNAERDEEIRRKYAEGKVSTYALAKEYFLTEQRIWQIISGYDPNKRKKKGCSI